MGYMGTELLTKGEHDRLWRNTFEVIPGIADSLRRSNAIECLKILHDAGRVTDEVFCEAIIKLIRPEGFTLE